MKSRRELKEKERESGSRKPMQAVQHPNMVEQLSGERVRRKRNIAKLTSVEEKMKRWLDCDFGLLN
jgi:hypothetical protein